LLAAYLVGVCVNVYIGYRDLDVVLSIFRNSYGITYYGRPREWSFFLRLSLTFSLSGTIARSGRYLRNGMLVPEEFAYLPIAIRRRMQWSAGLTTVGFLGLWVVFIAHEIF
jgi:hypothetical protein